MVLPRTYQRRVKARLDTQAAGNKSLLLLNSNELDYYPSLINSAEGGNTIFSGADSSTDSSQPRQDTIYQKSGEASHIMVITVNSSSDSPLEDQEELYQNSSEVVTSCPSSPGVRWTTAAEGAQRL